MHYLELMFEPFKFYFKNTKLTLFWLYIFDRYREMLDAEENEDDEVDNDDLDVVEIVPRSLNNMSSVLALASENQGDVTSVTNYQDSAKFANAQTPQKNTGLESVLRDMSLTPASPATNIHEGTSVWYSDDNENEDAFFQKIYERNQKILSGKATESPNERSVGGQIGLVSELTPNKLHHSHLGTEVEDDEAKAAMSHVENWLENHGTRRYSHNDLDNDEEVELKDGEDKRQAIYCDTSRPSFEKDILLDLHRQDSEKEEEEEEDRALETEREANIVWNQNITNSSDEEIEEQIEGDEGKEGEEEMAEELWAMGQVINKSSDRLDNNEFFKVLTEEERELSAQLSKFDIGRTEKDLLRSNDSQPSERDVDRGETLKSSIAGDDDDNAENSLLSRVDLIDTLASSTTVAVGRQILNDDIVEEDGRDRIDCFDEEINNFDQFEKDAMTNRASEYEKLKSYPFTLELSETRSAETEPFNYHNGNSAQYEASGTSDTFTTVTTTTDMMTSQGARPKVRHMLSNVELTSDGSSSHAQGRPNSGSSSGKGSQASLKSLKSGQCLGKKSSGANVKSINSNSKPNSPTENLGNINGDIAMQVNLDRQSSCHDVDNNQSEIQNTNQDDRLAIAHSVGSNKENINLLPSSAFAPPAMTINNTNNHSHHHPNVNRCDSTFDSAYVDCDSSGLTHPSSVTMVNTMSHHHSSSAEDSGLMNVNVNGLELRPASQDAEVIVESEFGLDSMGDLFMNTEEMQNSLKALQMASRAANKITEVS